VDLLKLAFYQLLCTWTFLDLYQAHFSVRDYISYSNKYHKYTSQWDKILGRWLIYIEHNKGSSTDPCGISLDKFRREEACVPDTTV